MKNRINLLLSFLLWANSLHSQPYDGDSKKYMVFTFEVQSWFTGLKKNYYWITPIDSIEKRNSFTVFPVYMDGFSKESFDECKQGKQIDIFTFSGSPDFNLGTDYETNLRDLLSLIAINRIKIQSLLKVWGKNQEDKINIYATPITGEFCNCLQSHELPSEGFKGTVYLPVGNFYFLKNFWATKDAKIVKYVDYTYVEYSSYYPTYIHGNSDIRVKGSITSF